MTPFETFWTSWPQVNGKRHHRAGKKAFCERRWKAMKLDAIADRVMSSLAAWKASKDWVKDNGEFIPAPEVFLNKTPWEAGDPPAAGVEIGKGPNGSDPERAKRIAQYAVNKARQDAR